MHGNRVPLRLQERLGPEATAGLLDVLNQARTEWTAEVTGVVGDRFEHRLGTESAALRMEMTQGFAGLRQEMARGLAAIGQEMAEGRASLRMEMAEGLAALRQEMVEGRAALRQEMAGGLAALRQEMVEGRAVLRQEITEGLAALRQEMTQGFGVFRQEIANQRFEILKWAFLFWIGQFFAVASLVALVIRYLRPAQL